MVTVQNGRLSAHRLGSTIHKGMTRRYLEKSVLGIYGKITTIKAIAKKAMLHWGPGDMMSTQQ